MSGLLYTSGARIARTRVRTLQLRGDEAETSGSLKAGDSSRSSGR